MRSVMRRMGLLLLGMAVTGCASARTTDRVYAFQQPVPGRDGGALVVAAADWAACDRAADRVAAYYDRMAGQEGALLGTLLLGLLGGLAVGAAGGQFEATQEIALMGRPGPGPAGTPAAPSESRRRARDQDYEDQMRRCLRSRGYAIDAPPDRRGFTP